MDAVIKASRECIPTKRGRERGSQTDAWIEKPNGRTETDIQTDIKPDQPTEQQTDKEAE